MNHSDLEQLLPTQQQLLYFMALANSPFNKTTLHQFARAFIWSQSSSSNYFSEQCQPLVEQNWLQPQGSLFIINAAYQQPLLELALEQPQFGLWCKYLESMDRPSPYQFPSKTVEVERQFRIMLLQGMTSTQIQSITERGSIPNYSPIAKLAHVWLSLLSPKLLARIDRQTSADLLGYVLLNATYPTELAPTLQRYAEQYQNDNTELLEYLFTERLLKGQWQQARAALTDKYPLEASLRLCLDCLEQGPDQQLSTFEQQLKQWRKYTGKRQAVLPGISGLIHLLLLLREPTGPHLNLAEQMINLRYKHQTGRVLQQQLLNNIEKLSGGAGFQYSRELGTLSALDGWLLGLTSLWAGGNQPDYDDYHSWLAYSQDQQYHWLSSQIQALMYRVYPKQKPRSFTATPSICDWFTKPPSWQLKLNALMELAGTKPAPESHAKNSRLVWFINPSPNATFTIELREQKAQTKGGWTAGRTIAPSRLLDYGPAIDNLTEADKLLATAVECSYSYSQSYSFNPNKALALLVGHPLVFDNSTNQLQLELVAGQIELQLETTNTGFKLKLQPPCYQNKTGIFVQQEDQQRYRVYQLTDEQQKLVALLADDFELPLEAQEQLQQNLPQLQRVLPVHDLQQTNAAETLSADLRPHLLLSPMADGLELQLRMKPHSHSDYFLPGKGIERLQIQQPDQSLWVQRQPAQEQRQAKQLAKQLDQLASRQPEPYQWLCLEQDECLDLLLALQALGEQIVVLWPQGQNLKTPRAISAQDLHFIGQQQQTWFQLSAELQLDEQRVLSLAELINLSRQPGHYVALGQGEFLALTQDLRQRLDELAALEQHNNGSLKVSPLMLPSLDDWLGTTSQLSTDGAWQQSLERARQAQQLPVKLPLGFSAELRDYQFAGFQWLMRLAHWGVGACLADDMGLGKTLQSIALVLARAAGGPSLIVVPTSLLGNWQLELARFAPSLRVYCYEGPQREQQLAQLQAGDLLLVSYGLLQNDLDWFQPIQWHNLIIDEAQAIKNSQTRRAQALYALTADFRLALTGTPIENHVGELWSLFRFINPGLLGSKDSFSRRFVIPIERDADKTARQRLSHLIQPFLLRRTKTQVLSELPECSEINLLVRLSEDEQHLYEVLRRQALAQLMQTDAPNQQRFQVLAQLMRLRRVCCHPDLVAPELALSSSKLETLTELLHELRDNGHRALIFSQFVDYLTLVRQLLEHQGISYQYLDGSVPAKERSKRVQEFQTGTGEMFLISLKAGGTGLNLTAADYVIHLDPWWNPAVEAQAVSRAHRLGQERPVTLYRLIAANTIEEKILALHQRKKDLANSLLADSDNTALDPELLLSLLNE